MTWQHGSQFDTAETLASAASNGGPHDEGQEDQAEPDAVRMANQQALNFYAFGGLSIPEVEPMTDLHAKIMNIPQKLGVAIECHTQYEAAAYAKGHRDARHAAAELAMLVQQEQAGFTVSLDFLKRVQESLSDYCGELDWGNADMELMDEVEAMLAAAPKGEKP